LISNRPELVLQGERQISMINEALDSHFFEADKVIVSLGVKLNSLLNLVSIAKNIEARIKRVLSVVVGVKLLLVI